MEGDSLPLGGDFLNGPRGLEERQKTEGSGEKKRTWMLINCKGQKREEKVQDGNGSSAG